MNSKLSRCLTVDSQEENQNIRGNEADIPQSKVDDAQMDVWNL